MSKKKQAKKQEPAKGGKQTYYCCVSGKPIPAARVEALRFMRVPEREWTCVEHSQARPVQGIYTGEAGTSQLLLVRKVYNDSVRSVFRASEAAAAAETEAEIEEDSRDE